MRHAATFAYVPDLGFAASTHPTVIARMPYRAPDYIEHDFSLLPDWLEHLADLFGPDHASVIARRGLEAAQ
jgi:hypothetical protein